MILLWCVGIIIILPANGGCCFFLIAVLGVMKSHKVSNRISLSCIWGKAILSAFSVSMKKFKYRLRVPIVIFFCSFTIHNNVYFWIFRYRCSVYLTILFFYCSYFSDWLVHIRLNFWILIDNTVSPLT